MAGSWWWDLLAGVTAGLLLAWVVLIAALVIVRPRGGLLRVIRQRHGTRLRGFPP
jgi:hypothetical protein